MAKKTKKPVEARQKDRKESIRRQKGRGRTAICSPTSMAAANPAKRCQEQSPLRRRQRLHRARHRGAGGARAGAPPPRHVYRRHRREGAASSLRRSDRQRDGRGARRPRDLHRGRTRQRRLHDRDRQRPRHSGRSASEISEKIRARSDHVHAACGRQIRFQGLRDLRRPARRRRVGRERAVGKTRSRGRARTATLQDDVRARKAERRAGETRPRAQQARHHHPLQAGRRRFSARTRNGIPRACSA